MMFAIAWLAATAVTLGLLVALVAPQRGPQFSVDELLALDEARR